MGLRKIGGFENLPTLDLLRDGEGTRTDLRLLTLKPNTGDYNQTVYTAMHDGEKKQFWGSAVLNRRLEEVELGSDITIVYKGTEPSPQKGRQPFKNFEVFLNDPNYDGDDSVETATAGKTAKTPF